MKHLGSVKGEQRRVIPNAPHSSPFTPYPSYKPSGVEWLGDVPVHWEVKA
jgi:hypothetical protein